MNKIKRKWDVLSPEKRNYLVREIINYFATERDEEIGVIAAEELLDFFQQNLHDEIYNQAVNDTKKTVKDSLDGLQIDLDLMINR
ncbi:MAG TPA: DUF2164 domain-containing protein [bacterium]|nr:DUF2164 domain-containing protein [bacterium]HPN67217.1 DUF2164 domain-containing protein [bacterium]